MATPPAPAPGISFDPASLKDPSTLHVLSTVHAIGQQTGLDTNNPVVANAIAKSSTVQKITQQTPPAPAAGRFNWQESPENAEQAGYTDKESALLNRQKTEQQYLPELQRAVADSAKLSNFNKSVYTEQRLKQMNPTEDIDKSILAVRQKALLDRASMWEDFQGPNGINPEAALSAIQTRQNMYTKQLNDLEDLRTARVNDAKAKIGDEIDSYTAQANAAQTHVDAIKSAIDAAKSAGATESDLAQLHIDMAQANKRLQKARSATNGLGTDGDMAYQALLQSYTRLTGQDPTTLPAAKKKQLQTLARNLSSSNPTLLGEINSGNDTRTVDAPDTRNILQRSWNAIAGGYTPPTRKVSDVDAYLSPQLTREEKVQAAELTARGKKAGVQ